MLAQARTAIVRNRAEDLGRPLVLLSIGLGFALALAKIIVGIHANSSSVLSDGLEASGDVISSTIVYIGLWIASKPPDDDHPYGHGRYETLSALAIGAMLLLAGSAILWHGITSFRVRSPLALWAIYPLLASIVVKVALGISKFYIGRRIASTSLEADAWHDVTDLLSTTIALTAVLLNLLDPVRFGAADHIGGIVIGIIIIFLSVTVVRNTVDQLVDAMPESKKMAEVRKAALSVSGALGIEKCFARRTGMKYHVDLHLEVDPDLTVRQSHEIATEVRFAIKTSIGWVADVLVHVEPAPVAPRSASPFARRFEHKHGK